MCGIYAIFSKSQAGLSASDLEVFSQMAILTQLRGSDSSGVFAVDKEKPTTLPKIVKTLGPSSFLPYEKNWDVWKKFAFDKAGVVVGHGRSATVGKVTKKNAHPFVKNHITLVHNGTINSGIDKVHEDEVDSAGLCNQIAERGLDKALDTIRGAYALIIHDSNTGLIHVVRNYERPLAFLSNSEAIYILSERRALEYLYQRSAFIKFGVIQEFNTETVYTFNLTTKEMTERPLERTRIHSSFSGGIKKQFLPSPAPIPEPAKPNEMPAIVYKQGAKIQFRVKLKMDPKEGEKDFIYIGKDEEDRTIFFKSAISRDDLVGKIGVGEYVGARFVATTKTWLYQVKARTIKWEDEEEEDVLVQDGEVISKKLWRSLCEKETCCLCFERIPESDNEETLVFQSGGQYKMICQHCRKDGLAQYNEPDCSKLIQRIMS